jgi:protein AFG1
MRSTRSFLLNSIRKRHFTANHSPVSHVATNLSMENDGGKNLDSTLSTPLSSYLDMVLTGEISEDNHQLGAVKKLQSLYDQILVIDSSIVDVVPTLSSSWFSSIFDSSIKKSETAKKVNVDNIKGLYMYGGTGCGKTFIMDLFFEMVPIKRKKRVHFSNFMIDIHKRLHRLKSVTTGSNKSSGDNIMEQITDELMNEAYLLCFDEFQVTDIADAMIIKSLFESLLNKGMVIVATSNRPPIDLYKNGLQRSLFLPFIKMLSESTDVHSLMESSMDYRLVKGAHSAQNMYLSPVNKENESNFDKQFKRLSVPISQEYQKQLQDELSITGISRYPLLSIQMSVFGHLITSTHTIAGRRIAKFSFNQLCDENLGAADYIHLSETFRIIFLSHVPILTMENRNEVYF